MCNMCDSKKVVDINSAFLVLVNWYSNECFDRSSMEVELPALLGNYDQLIDGHRRGHRNVTVSKTFRQCRWLTEVEKGLKNYWFHLSSEEHCTSVMMLVSLLWWYQPLLLLGELVSNSNWLIFPPSVPHLVLSHIVTSCGLCFWDARPHPSLYLFLTYLLPHSLGHTCNMVHSASTGLLYCMIVLCLS